MEWGAQHKDGVQRLLGALDVQILVGHTVGRTHTRPILGIPRTGSGCLVHQELTFKGSTEIQTQGSEEPEKKAWNNLELLQRILAAGLHREQLVKPKTLSSTHFLTVTAVLSRGWVTGGYRDPTLAPRERMGTSTAAPLAVKEFPEKQQPLWEISG